MMVNDHSYQLRSRNPNYSYKTISRCRTSDFFESQIASKCALHAIHNLFRTNQIISEREMNNAAKKCAEESGDTLSNHCSADGNWSLETLRRALTDKNYIVKTAIEIHSSNNIDWVVPRMCACWSTPSIKGFILLKPPTENLGWHFIVLRKGYAHNTWELVDSLSGIHLLNPIKFYNDTIEKKWSAYLVSSHI